MLTVAVYLSPYRKQTPRSPRFTSTDFYCGGKEGVDIKINRCEASPWRSLTIYQHPASVSSVHLARGQHERNLFKRNAFVMENSFMIIARTRGE